MNENLKAFLQKASEDEALKAKLTEINESVMNDAKAKFVKLAQECGYSFTEEDMDPVSTEAEKLSEDELNAAAAGAYSVEDKYGKLFSGCACSVAGNGTADELQKRCVCVLGGCGELTALGKQKADKNEIYWSGNKKAKVAMYCPLVGRSY